MLLSEALREFDLALVGSAADSTRTWYRRRLGALVEFLGDPDVAAVSAADLRRWKASLVERDRRWSEHPSRPEVAGGFSPWTLHGYVRAARRFFGWLAREGYVKRNPAGGLELPPLPDEPPKAIGRADLAKMLEAARASGARDYALVRFLADTGCRVGGLVGLTLGELSLERRRALVWEKGRGGKRKARTVFFGEETAEALQAWLTERPDGTGYVFVGKRGKLSEGGVYQILRRLAALAGVEGRFNPHSFRHGWARAALEEGADLGTVSQILGHSGIAVTHQFYARWADEELAARHERFSWLNSSGDKMSPDEV